MAKRIVNKHSLVKCKTIRPDQIEFGEISVNAHEHGPYLNIKDRLGQIIRVGGVVFSPHQPCAEKGAWWVEERPGGDHALWVFDGNEWILLLESIESDSVINWDDITGIPECFPACEHTHPWDEVTDKPDCFEPCEHTHPAPDWGEIPGKPDCFEPCEHTHPPTAWPDIPEKPDCFEPCEHEHKWEQVTDKPCLYHCHDYIQHLDPLPA